MTHENVKKHHLFANYSSTASAARPSNHPWLCIELIATAGRKLALGQLRYSDPSRSLLVHVLRDLQNVALRFEHEFFLLAQWLLLVKQARNLIKRVMCTTACLVLLRSVVVTVRTSIHRARQRVDLRPPL